MSWKIITEEQPDPECEVVLFSGAVQNTSFTFYNEGMGWYWDANNADIDVLIPVEPADQWQYLEDIKAPKPQ